MPDFARRSPNGGDPSLPEINETDRLLDALAMEQPVYPNDPDEAELAYLLAGWRDEVRQPATSMVVTPRDAAIALDRATAAPPPRRFSLAIVGSVAAAVLCLGGFGSLVYGAGPGDPLYGVRTMLFGEQLATRDDQVALAAQTQMSQVEQLIQQGDWTAAEQKLQTLTTTVAAVGDANRQQELVDQWQQLAVKVETQDPAATVPPDAPPVVLPEVPPDLPLPVLLSPDATSPSNTTSADAPSSSDPSATPSSAEPSATPSSTEPSSTPSMSVTPEPATTATGAPVEAPPPSSAPSSTVPATTPAQTTTVQTTVAPTTSVPTTTVRTTTVPTSTVPASTTTSVVGEVESEQAAPTRSAPSVEQQPEADVVTTTTVVAPLPGSGSAQE